MGRQRSTVWSGSTRWTVTDSPRRSRRQNVSRQDEVAFHTRNLGFSDGRRHPHPANPRARPTSPGPSELQPHHPPPPVKSPIHLIRSPAALAGRLIRIVHALPMNEISGSGNSISQVHFPEETIRFRKTVRRPAPMRVEVRAGQNCALPTSGRTMEAATAKEVMIT